MKSKDPISLGALAELYNDTPIYVKNGALLAIAEQYHSYGLQVIPATNNKAPQLKSWAEIQTELASIEFVRTWFKKFNGGYIGFICGSCSGKLEVIDIDSKYDLTGKLAEYFFEALKDALPDICLELVFEETENKGFHIFYRCSELEYSEEKKKQLNWGNTLLAQRPATIEEQNQGEKKKVLIETRGHGGFIVTAPSKGYKLVQGSFKSIPNITLVQRNQIFEIARSFDQCVDESKKEAWIPNDFEWKGETPWESYDNQNGHDQVLQLLESNGYKAVKKQSKPAATVILRPGNTTNEHSGYLYEDTGAVKMFSSSTEFEPEKSYYPSMTYTLLEHSGDHSKAFKQLYLDGYGHRQPDVGVNTAPRSDKIAFTKSHLSQHFDLMFNELTNDYECNKEPITDTHINNIYI